MMESGETKQGNPRWYRLQIRARRAFNRIPLREHQKIYILTLLIGALCGLAAVLFHLLLDSFQEHIIYRAAAIPHWWRVPLVLLIPTLGGLVAGAGLYLYAPEARDSGIPQVKAALQHWPSGVGLQRQSYAATVQGRDRPGGRHRG